MTITVAGWTLFAGAQNFRTFCCIGLRCWSWAAKWVRTRNEIKHYPKSSKIRFNQHMDKNAIQQTLGKS